MLTATGACKALALARRSPLRAPPKARAEERDRMIELWLLPGRCRADKDVEWRPASAFLFSSSTGRSAANSTQMTTSEKARYRKRYCVPQRSRVDLRLVSNRLVLPLRHLSTGQVVDSCCLRNRSVPCPGHGQALWPAQSRETQWPK